MNRPLLGLLAGTLLGALDGASAWFTAPELRAEVGGIILGSCTKGLLAGLVTGFVVRKTGSIGRGIMVGLLAALVLTVPIAILNVQAYDNPSYYWKIILPGALTGLMVGYATVRYGRAPQRTAG